jgi:hypothetical protein
LNNNTNVLEGVQGFENYDPKDTILLLQQTLNGTKQAANTLWYKASSITILAQVDQSADSSVIYANQRRPMIVFQFWSTVN